MIHVRRSLYPAIHWIPSNLLERRYEKLYGIHPVFLEGCHKTFSFGFRYRSRGEITFVQFLTQMSELNVQVPEQILTLFLTRLNIF